MVDDLLDLARVEAGRITVSPAWFEMVDLFAALRGMFKPIVQNETVHLVFDEPEGVGRLYTRRQEGRADPRNYVSNALKFTQHGEVRVRARADGRTSSVFSVSDTGIGISPEHVSALFKDYIQLDSKVQRKLRGTGLGLALSRRFAEILGGSVWVESEVGVGSTFYARLPVRLPEPEGDGSPVGAPPAKDHGS
jgi:signal transduction histidine kinase